MDLIQFLMRQMNVMIMINIEILCYFKITKINDSVLKRIIFISIKIEQGDFFSQFYSGGTRHRNLVK